MAVKFTPSPWEAGFESLASQTKATAAQVKKSAQAGVVNMASTAKAQVTGVENQPAGSQQNQTAKPQESGLMEQLGLKAIPAPQKQDVQQKQQQQLQQTRSNLERINQEIEQARKNREKKEEERKQQAEKEEEQKKQLEEKKKKEDPLWKRMLKGQTGSREGAKNVAG